MKVHHIGYIVDNMENSIKEFEGLGFKILQKNQYDEIRDINICFIENGGIIIELVQPKTKESVIYKMAGKYKNMPYHICYETDDMDRDIERLKQRGYMVIQKPERAPAINNSKVVFLMHLDMGIIELLEKNKGVYV